MKYTPIVFRQCGKQILPVLSLLLLGTCASQAQTFTQPISPTAGLPVVTGTFNHTSIVNIASVPYDFNYYDFTITGFTNVGAGNPYYAIYSFSNSTLEKLPGVVGVAASYLPDTWTFDDTNDFRCSTLIGIYPDDPQFGLIFIQTPGTTPIDPTGAPFEFYHETGGVDPFTYPGTDTPVTVPVNPSAVPEPSSLLTFCMLSLGVGGLLLRARKRNGMKNIAA